MPFSWQASRTVRVKVLGESPWILSVAMIVSSLSVLVVPSHPGHREGQPLFVAALRGDVEQLIGAVQHVEPAGVGRIGAVDRAVLAAAEGTEARGFLAIRLDRAEIVLRLLF